MSTSPLPMKTKAYGPDKLNWWYEDLISWMLINPGCRLQDAARHFGKTQAWISVIINSGVFKARLEERRKELNIEMDELLIYKMRRVAHESFDALLERVSAEKDTMKVNTLLEVATKVTDSLGGGRGRGRPSSSNEIPPQQVNVQVVVPVSAHALEEARTKIRLIEGQRLLGPSETTSRDEED